MNKWYNSSVNPEQLSWTIGGFSVLGISNAIVLIAGAIGHPVGQSDVETFVVAVLTAVGSITAIVGMVRKVAVYVASKYNKTS